MLSQFYVQITFLNKNSAEVKSDIPKFSIWTLFVSRVQKCTSIKQCTVNISYHAVDLQKCHKFKKKNIESLSGLIQVQKFMRVMQRWNELNSTK